ncbi:hypothetical protein Cpir12675_003541 [Ceratocystis pirilliformis]|uniref:HNH nuclease domain-containing protein n=1 Tax=Ceratocystis pirilliformis TaxID=259994 RepID=A0ABR3Z2Z6_9PEZI
MNNVEVPKDLENILRSHPLWTEISRLNGIVITDRTVRKNAIELRPGSLYLLISSPTYKPLGKQQPRPMAKRWHWSLYSHISDTHGQTYHITHVNNDEEGPVSKTPQSSSNVQLGQTPVNGSNSWEFESNHIENMPQNIPVVCAIRIAKIDDELQCELEGRVAKVPLVPDISRRGFDGNDVIEDGISSCSWLLRALHDLDQEGWISIKLPSSADDIYNEAVYIGVQAEQIDAPLVKDSQFAYL